MSMPTFRLTSLAVLAALVLLSSPVALAVDSATWPAIRLAGREVAPGTSSRFAFVPDRSFEASYLNAPVFVARGASPGPSLCLTAGIHGDELNGVEVARRSFAQTDPGTLKGTLIVFPSINAEGVRTGNRYLSDRRDLNRAFPGTSGGSVASLIAHAVFSELVEHCDALVDLHTASNNRSNFPQIRADLHDPVIVDLASQFGFGIVIGGKGPDGSLRRETAKAGIPAIIYEAGEPLRFQEEEIANGVAGVMNIMIHLEMIPPAGAQPPPARIFEKSKWLRAKRREGGFFFPSATLGQLVEKGDRLGRIVDPLTDEEFVVESPLEGEIIGMALPQPVLSGYGLFHIAWKEGN